MIFSVDNESLSPNSVGGGREKRPSSDDFGVGQGRRSASDGVERLWLPLGSEPIVVRSLLRDLPVPPADGRCRRRVPFEIRFWRMVDRSAGPMGCWTWTGSTNGRGGYGVIKFVKNGLTRYVHRIALEMKLGRDLLSEEDAIHSCDNPPCCNYAHLRAGTRADNMADAAAKRRTPIEHDDALILGVLRRIAAGEAVKTAAREAGVSRSGITSILAGKCRKELFSIAFPGGYQRRGPGWQPARLRS
jgi:hypothetical protein